MLSVELEDARRTVQTHPALVDPITGLANWLQFKIIYDCLHAAGNRGIGFTVLLISCGDETEDEEVASIGQALGSATRNSDFLSYAGVGRFLMLLIGTNLQGGRVAADRLEAAIHGSTSEPIALGLAGYGSDIAAGDLLSAAERAALGAQAAGGGVALA